MIKKVDLIKSICKRIGITRNNPKKPTFTKTELYALDFYIQHRNDK